MKNFALKIWNWVPGVFLTGYYLSHLKLISLQIEMFIELRLLHLYYPKSARVELTVEVVNGHVF